jgi:hypothetical protein
VFQATGWNVERLRQGEAKVLVKIADTADGARHHVVYEQISLIDVACLFNSASAQVRLLL